MNSLLALIRRLRVSYPAAAALSFASCGGDGRLFGPGDNDDDPAVSLTAPRVFANLSFDSPTAMLQVPGHADRWFVVEQDGVVRVFDNEDAVASSSVFIDIGARVTSPVDGNGPETGLLGLAFHPGFPDNDSRAYLSYTASVNGQLVSRISEFTTEDSGATLAPASEIVLLTVNQPEINHNGGNIVFGPDGFLYIGFGDGGGSGDVHGSIGNGQNTTTLLGKILRIDVDQSVLGFNYAIPAANPYEGNALCGNDGSGLNNCPEIYAYGFRNPWRFSFDSIGGDLWVGDVGQDLWEEVDKVTVGGNYGWRCREGAHNFNTSCGSASGLIDPVAEYDHGVGFSITGGFVYRGSAIADLSGRYVFGDLGGRVFSIARDTDPTRDMKTSDGFDTGLQISSFAQDSNGELYIVDYGGTIHRLEKN